LEGLVERVLSFPGETQIVLRVRVFRGRRDRPLEKVRRLGEFPALQTIGPKAVLFLRGIVEQLEGVRAAEAAGDGNDDAEGEQLHSSPPITVRQHGCQFAGSRPREHEAHRDEGNPISAAIVDKDDDGRVDDQIQEHDGRQPSSALDESDHRQRQEHPEGKAEDPGFPGEARTEP
jgi:hypothetical protein